MKYLSSFILFTIATTVLSAPPVTPSKAKAPAPAPLPKVPEKSLKQQTMAYVHQIETELKQHKLKPANVKTLQKEVMWALNQARESGQSVPINVTVAKQKKPFLAIIPAPVIPEDDSAAKICVGSKPYCESVLTQRSFEVAYLYGVYLGCQPLQQVCNFSNWADNQQWIMKQTKKKKNAVHLVAVKNASKLIVQVKHSAQLAKSVNTVVGGSFANFAQRDLAKLNAIKAKTIVAGYYTWLSKIQPQLSTLAKTEFTQLAKLNEANIRMMVGDVYTYLAKAREGNIMAKTNEPGLQELVSDYYTWLSKKDVVGLQTLAKTHPLLQVQQLAKTAQMRFMAKRQPAFVYLNNFAKKRDHMLAKLSQSSIRVLAADYYTWLAKTYDHQKLAKLDSAGIKGIVGNYYSWLAKQESHF